MSLSVGLDEDEIKIFSKLRECLVEGYVSMLHGMSGDAKDAQM